MLRRALLPALGISLSMLALGVTAGDRHRTIRAFAELVPANEVPSISSVAHGTFKATIDLVESMGSELFVYFDVAGGEIEASELVELAKDAGMEDLPSHGSGQQVVARLDAGSGARAGGEVELVLDTSGLKLFDPEGGRSMTALHREAAPASA